MHYQNTSARDKLVPSIYIKSNEALHHVSKPWMINVHNYYIITTNKIHAMLSLSSEKQINIIISKNVLFIRQSPGNVPLSRNGS